MKVKLHLLVHLEEDIRRFGPAIRNSTEIFECYNAIFLFCSIFSNHQAPSRDIARQFAAMDGVKHILSGGYWKHNDKWIRASPAVLHVLKTDSFIQCHLGWVPPRPVSPGTNLLVSFSPDTLTYSPGSICLKPIKKAPICGWFGTLTSKVIGNGTHMGEADIQELQSNTYRHGECVTAHSGDQCSIGTWVYARQPNQELMRGRIIEILVPQAPSRTESYVTIEEFTLGENRHPILGMPVLSRDVTNPSYTMVHSTVRVTP